MYLGTFDSFRFTAAAATPCDSIVNAGEFYGVTKANVEAGEEGLAFIGVPAVVFELPVTALAAAKTMGSAVYVDSNGALTFTSSGNTKFGVLWADAASGATAIKVALR